MREMLLLKCGELVLKGMNRARFQAQLEGNLKRRLRHIGEFDMYGRQSTIYVEPVSGSDLDAAMEAAKKVFGIVSVSRAVTCEKDMGDILQKADGYLKEQLAGVTRFKVDARRADKRFPLTSPQIAAEVGGYLHEQNPHLIPDMTHPELTVTVEIREAYAFVHGAREKGAGGMPVGSNGRACLLLSGGIDSPAAGYLMARRGLSLSCVHFFSYPYTSEKAREKVIELAKILTEYTGRMVLYLVPFTKIQEEIRDKSESDMYTVVMRRFMMRIASQLAGKDGAGALVTGESLGQVASQTMEAMGVTEAVADLPVFRPLIGLDKEDIVKIARKIGTFETSILPYEDCCTVFTPKHPVTRPKKSRAEAAEKGLDADGLIAAAIQNTEKIIVG